MAVISLRKFSGEIPKTKPHLLPEDAAQQAIYCDLTHGTLAPLKQGLALKVAGQAGWTGSSPTKGIYTEDGIYFFTWSSEVSAFKSPVIDEAYGRVYYLNSGAFSATLLSYASTAGGAPSSSWTVGVPAYATAPALALVERTTLADYPSAALTFTGWYEKDGVKYDQAAVTATATGGNEYRIYTFTAPTKDPATPAEAKLVINVVLKSGNQSLFNITTTEGAAAARTTALPGGVEIKLRLVSGTTYAVDFTWGVVETRAYVLTTVNTWNEESEPSPASLISVTYLQDVTVTAPSTPSFTGYRPFSGMHVYRTFGANTTYLRVTASPTSSPYTDSVRTSTAAKGTLNTTDWKVPPTGLSAVVAMPNGYFAAFKGNTLYFSEPYHPQAWPYSMTFPKNVRGVCVGSQALVVTTADSIYNVTGSHPAALSQTLLPVPQAGIAHRSMTKVNGAVALASHDGLVFVEGSAASLDFSQKFFNRDDWRTKYGTILSDASLRLSYHDGFLVGTSSTTDSGFIVRTDEAGNAFSQFNDSVDCTFQLPVLDTLYYAEGPNIYEFRAGGSTYAMDWWSKDFIFPKHVAFSVGYIETTGTVTVTLYAGGVQYYQVVINATGVFRIPSGNAGANLPAAHLKWSFRIQGTGTVSQFVLASSMEELRRVGG